MYTVTPHNARRYRLHYKIRKQGFTLITKSKTVYVSGSKKWVPTRQLEQLMHEYGYAVQFQIA